MLSKNIFQQGKTTKLPIVAMFFLKMIYEIFIEDITNNIAAKFGSNWQGSFRGEEFYSFNQSESRSAHHRHSSCWIKMKWKNFLEVPHTNIISGPIVSKDVIKMWNVNKEWQMERKQFHQTCGYRDYFWDLSQSKSSIGPSSHAKFPNETEIM